MCDVDGMGGSLEAIGPEGETVASTNLLPAPLPQG